MTVLADTLTDLAGNGEVGKAITFVPIDLRDSGDGTHGVRTRVVTVGLDSDGSFTTDDLEPGDAWVRIDGVAYRITIPDSPTPVRLMPLIEAGLPVPPEQEAFAIRNLGGLAAGMACSNAYFAGITPVDDHFYFVWE